MLKAFEPLPIIELRQKDKSKIESILAFGEKVLVGLNSGALRIYRVNEVHNNVGPDHDRIPDQTQAKDRKVELLREIEKFSRRPVEQLAVIKEANVLISLSDGLVSFHDLQTYELQEQLSKTRGASGFAVTSEIVKDPSSGILSIVSRLAVSVKRTLLLWSWHDTEVSFDTNEISLSAPARSLTWASGVKLIWGTNSGYAVIDVLSKDTHDVLASNTPGAPSGSEPPKFGNIGATGIGYMGMGNWTPQPLATPLMKGEVLLAKDINTLFTDAEGRALKRRQIPWSTAPESVAFSYPYILALQPSTKGVLEVRNPETLSLLQTISLPNASIMHVPQLNVSLAHAGKGFLVASDRCIWRMEASAYESQLDQLIFEKRLDEAISLLDLLESALFDGREKKIRDIKIAKAETLFTKRKYRDSLELFTSVSTPSLLVLRLYPSSINAELDIVKDEDAVNPPDGSNEGASTNDKSKASLKDEGTSETTSISTPKARPSEAGSMKSPRRRRSSSGTASVGEKAGAGTTLAGNDLKSATTALLSYLVDVRQKIQKRLAPDGTLLDSVAQDDQDSTFQTDLNLLFEDQMDEYERNPAGLLLRTAQIVDTTLFKAYMFARPLLVGSLVRIDNFCDPAVVQEKFLESENFVDLIDFLHGKGLHRQALELLTEFGKGERGISPTNFKGAQKIVRYLQSLPPSHVDLILEFAEWPVRTDTDVGMEVFLADSENAETLPRDKILHFLQNLDFRLAVRYLEHVVNELNDMSPEFHQILISLYLDQLKWRDVNKSIEEEGDDDRDWEGDLLNVLEKSTQYSPDRVLKLLPKKSPAFFEPRAVVLGKKGDHKQALEIYVFEMKNFKKAEGYCNRTYGILDDENVDRANRPKQILDQDDSNKSVYQTLLSLYLAPPSPHKPNKMAAMNLLSTHGARLPENSTLGLVPESISLQELESYFRGRMRATNSQMCQARITSRLLETDLVDAKAALLLGEGPRQNQGRNRRVVVEEDRLCGVCHKRIGRSVISVFPE